MGAGFGAFGKIPSAGDFLRIDLPGSVVTPLDGWLQSLLLAGPQRFAEGWDAAYMSAPIWRFTLSAGLCGPTKVLGVMMPSVDRVGRRFPLTLAAQPGGSASAALDHFRAAEVFARLEDVALETLEDGVSRDMLQARLAGLTLPSVPAAPLRRVGGALIAAPGGAEELAAGLLATHYAAPSLWSTVLDGTPRLMACDGLPGEALVDVLFAPDAPSRAEAIPA